MDKVYFQGDVTLIEIKNIPEGATKAQKTDKGFVLAIGELTGHYHAITEDTCEVYEKDGRLYLKVNSPIEIYHQEHLTTPINIETGIKEKISEGIYEVEFPQEYDHYEQEARRVQD